MTDDRKVQCPSLAYSLSNKRTVQAETKLKLTDGTTEAPR